MTENQRMILAIAEKTPGKWVSLKGVCLAGKFGGRGIPQVVSGLVKAGLIEESFRNLGTTQKPQYCRCVRVKPK